MLELNVFVIVVKCCNCFQKSGLLFPVLATLLLLSPLQTASLLWFFDFLSLLWCLSMLIPLHHNEASKLLVSFVSVDFLVISPVFCAPATTTVHMRVPVDWCSCWKTLESLLPPLPTWEFFVALIGKLLSNFAVPLLPPLHTWEHQLIVVFVWNLCSHFPSSSLCLMQPMPALLDCNSQLILFHGVATLLLNVTTAGAPESQLIVTLVLASADDDCTASAGWLLILFPVLTICFVVSYFCFCGFAIVMIILFAVAVAVLLQSLVLL